jgi:N utilization substance protein A
VPDDQLSLAIGRQGQNVRLAAALLGWRIDVKSEQKYAKFSGEGFQSLLEVQGMDEKTAEALYDAGFSSAQDLAEAEVATVVAELESLDENRVVRLIAAAQKVEIPHGQDDSEPASTETGE